MRRERTVGGAPSHRVMLHYGSCGTGSGTFMNTHHSVSNDATTPPSELRSSLVSALSTPGGRAHSIDLNCPAVFAQCTKGASRCTLHISTGAAHAPHAVHAGKRAAYAARGLGRRTLGTHPRTSRTAAAPKTAHTHTHAFESRDTQARKRRADCGLPTRSPSHTHYARPRSHLALLTLIAAVLAPAAAAPLRTRVQAPRCRARAARRARRPPRAPPPLPARHWACSPSRCRRQSRRTTWPP